MVKILLIDSYDSFTYNLVDYLTQFGGDVHVLANNDNKLTNEKYLKQFQGIVLSPGPSRPENAGHLLFVCSLIRGKVPILGICLGMQALALHLGGQVIHAKMPMHGKTSFINHAQIGVFTGISSPMEVMRYHSLVVATNTLPKAYFSAFSLDTDEPMALYLDKGLTQAVQFHPESILTQFGKCIIKNWLHSLQNTNL